MFTGIIEATGNVQGLQQLGGDVRLTIASTQLDFSDVNLGDSIAANGICLTVVDFAKTQQGGWYAVDVSKETLNHTCMHTWQVGTLVNLEKAMLPTTRFGGHIVAGHVDGVGKVTKKQQDARSIYIEIELPQDLAKYVATKGSLTLDGISLTTNLVKDTIVCLNIIPHTAQVTNINAHWYVGSLVNVEVDVLARYLERLMLAGAVQAGGDEQKNRDITPSFLAQHGFLR